LFVFHSVFININDTMLKFADFDAIFMLSGKSLLGVAGATSAKRF